MPRLHGVTDQLHLQTWERIVRFIAVEDSQEYLGDLVDPDVDGMHSFVRAD